jgi:hypothetical protein
MALNYGIKVSKQGYDTSDIDRNMVFSSKFQSMKVLSRGSGSVYDSTGRTVTIAHNLGYTPVFLVHLDTIASSTSAICPLYYDPSDTTQEYRDQHVVAWADNTNLYIKVHDDYGWDYFGTSRDGDNYGTNLDSFGYLNNALLIGNFGTGHPSDGALRVLNVTYAKNASFVKAEAGFYIWASTGSVKTLLYGIDEDNTSNFAGDPFARTKTTAYTSPTKDSGVGSGNIWRVDFTNQFAEIISRNGWSSGNAMGLFMLNNANSVGVYFGNIDSASVEDGGTWNSKSHIRVLRNDNLLNYKYTIFTNQLQ